LKASDFPRKYSVQFIAESGKTSRPFYFNERDPHESSVTWQVDRAVFDKLLLDNAASCGADVRQGMKVEKVLFDGTSKEKTRATGVGGVDADGEPFEIRADVVVDATGLGSLSARQLGWLQRDARLDKAAIYAHFENAHRDSGVDEGATLIIHTKGNRGWFWYIPLSRNRVSVGVVGKAGELLKGRGAPVQVLEEEIAACPAVAERLRAAKRSTGVYTTSDFTYRARQCAADGLVLVGDAYGFLDPVYSSGLLLALKSGELAADAIREAFRAGEFTAPRLGSFGPRLADGMESFRALIYAFYTPGFSFAEFVSKHPEHREALIRLLIGDVFRGGFDELFESMRPFCDLPPPQSSPTADPLSRGLLG